jgi:hypothetical protein
MKHYKNDTLGELKFYSKSNARDMLMPHTTCSNSSEKIHVAGIVGVVASTRSRWMSTTVRTVQWDHYPHVTTLTVCPSLKSLLTTRTPGPLEPWQLQALVSLMLYIHHLQNLSFTERLIQMRLGP